jgi:hypothetical protein
MTLFIRANDPDHREEQHSPTDRCDQRAKTKLDSRHQTKFVANDPRTNYRHDAKHNDCHAARD